MLIQAKDLYKDIVLPHMESTFKKAGLTLDVEAEQILDHTALGPSVPGGPEKPGKAWSPKPGARSLGAVKPRSPKPRSCKAPKPEPPKSGAWKP